MELGGRGKLSVEEVGVVVNSWLEYSGRGMGSYANVCKLMFVWRDCSLLRPMF